MKLGVNSYFLHFLEFNVKEGLEKSFAFLKPLLLEKPTGTTWWKHGSVDLSREG